MILAHVNAAHWWGPAGWLYRNTPGNIAASVIWAVPAYLIGVRRGWKKLHSKLDELHSKHDRLHAHLGVPDGS